MKIHREIIKPKKRDDLVVHLPDYFLDNQIEVIAFPLDEKSYQERQPVTYEEAVKFYKTNGVDFSKLRNWTREELYE